MDHIVYCDKKVKELSHRLIGFKDIHEIEPFSYVREKNMDDWIIVESIEDVKNDE